MENTRWLLEPSGLPSTLDGSNFYTDLSLSGYVYILCCLALFILWNSILVIPYLCR